MGETDPDRSDTRGTSDFAGPSVFWGVALTQKGRIAVHSEHVNAGPHELRVYDDLDAASDDLPDDIEILARSALDPTYVEELDI